VTLIRGGQRSVTHTFLLFEALFLMLLKGRVFVTKQDKASKDTFILIHLIFRSNLGLKINHQKIEKCHIGGRGVEKCHILFEWYLKAKCRPTSLIKTVCRDLKMELFLPS
jgi:hypothetical protein